MRNLAWVELARDGRILRWSVEDLMAPAETDSSLPSNGIGPAVETPIEATEQTDLGATEPESKKRGAKAKYTLKIKTDSIAYNPREVALRVDRVMSNIVNSETLEGIVLEQQRFRSGGFHAVLDVTIKCSIIEGMIHTWVALWQQRWAQQHSNSVAGQYSREGEPIYIESVPPKAVGSWWSEEGNKVRDAWEVPSRKKRGAKNAELDKVSNQDIPETIESEVQKRPSPSSAYQAKKRRARAIVDSWINVEDKVETAHCSMQGIDQKMVPLKLVSRSNVDCPPELKEWYCMERKRDDLSDCLLQAVAWYEWKQRAIKEAIELSHKLENESNTPVKARS
ncbi:hypothetical protein BGW38_006864 [Lunasporangiospora selenospora]|uniref:Mitochondrial resolvase Ydc2 catalytic domain-containing protein n=1 Tax=Lunasporangiospora selenospora TaxID=979761 RepID=A0A9P6FZ94_9FUNG|nr:hypothetical protein BGW38_006864 [Lunasporangiospora selenospora]